MSVGVANAPFPTLARGDRRHRSGSGGPTQVKSLTPCGWEQRAGLARSTRGAATLCGRPAIEGKQINKVHKLRFLETNNGT